MLTDLLKPHFQLGTFLLRVGLGTIFLAHGFLKVTAKEKFGAGWNDELPEATQLAVAWGETVCGVALLVGFGSRLAAVGVFTIMIGAIILQTGDYDFVNVQRQIHGRPTWVPTGYGFNFAIMVMCLAIMAMGSGVLSVDHLLFGPRKAAETTSSVEAAPTAGAAPTHAVHS
jgi:uncharacterized membrane protein YphA (DoxX/SURF4 family)